MQGAPQKETPTLESENYHTCWAKFIGRFNTISNTSILPGILTVDKVATNSNT
jgi:hypothetical protein